MKNSTFFPREERADVLFEKILHDPWACERLQETFAITYSVMMNLILLFLHRIFQKLFLMLIKIKIYRHFLWLSARIPYSIY